MTTNLEIASDRNLTIATIKANLRARSDRTWSVTGGKGTAWGWITISAPPARKGGYSGGCMSDDDIAELERLIGHAVRSMPQGILVPASSDYRIEYLERSAGLEVTTKGEAYWD